jgi:hypothetical protein
MNPAAASLVDEFRARRKPKSIDPETKNRLAEYDWFKTFNMPDERIAHRLGITTDALGIMLRRRGRTT